MERRIYRSRKNKVIAGVLGGFAEYFKLDPVVVRIIYVAACLVVSPLLPLAVIAYIIGAIIIPQYRDTASDTGFQGSTEEYTRNDFNSDKDRAENDFGFNPEDWREPPKHDSEKSRKVIGIVLVSLGGLALLQQLVHWFDFKYLAPVLLVAVGLLIIYKGRRPSV